MEDCHHFDIFSDGNYYEECDCENFRSRIGTLHGYMKSMTKLDLQKIREEAMVEVLHQRQMNVNNVENLLEWEMIPKIDGWIPNTRQSLQFKVEAFNSLQGFKVNRATGKLDFAFKQGDPLISLEDIKYLINGGFNYLFFSLDAPNYADMPHHPFQQFRFGPKHLEQGDILQTLFHTDYLLKFFTQGVDIQFQVPFRIRPIEDNLLSRLPKYLQDAVRSTDKRDQTNKLTHSNTRFWIECESVETQNQSNANNFQYLFGEVKMIVKQHPMSKQGTELKDDASLINENSPDADFARDFTKYYNQIATWFPEFNRLKEISKAILMINKLYDIHKEMAKDANSCKDPLVRNNKVSAANKLGSYLGVDQNIRIPNQSELWIPAAFQKFINPFSWRYTYGGVSLQPTELLKQFTQPQLNFTQFECRGVEQISKLLNAPTQTNSFSQLSTGEQLSNLLNDYSPAVLAQSNYTPQFLKVSWIKQPLSQLPEISNQELKNKLSKSLMQWNVYRQCTELLKFSSEKFIKELKSQNDKGLDSYAPNLSKMLKKYDNGGPPDPYNILPVLTLFTQGLSAKKELQNNTKELLSQLDLLCYKYTKGKEDGQQVDEMTEAQLKKKYDQYQKQNCYETYARMEKFIRVDIIQRQEWSNLKTRNQWEVPRDKEGKILDNSGCTVNGCDVGQFPHWEAQKMFKDVPGAYEECKPRIGLKGYNAIQAYQRNPKTMSFEMSDQIKVANRAYCFLRFERQIISVIGAKNYELLTKEQRTGLFSRAFQYGRITPFKKLWKPGKQLQKWTSECAKLLRDTKTKYKTRTNENADLIEGIVKPKEK